MQINGDYSNNGCLEQNMEESDDESSQPSMNLFGFGGIINSSESQIPCEVQIAETKPIFDKMPDYKNAQNRMAVAPLALPAFGTEFIIAR